MKKILIINTGGTFCKYPNKTFDEMIVDNSKLSEEILKEINFSNTDNIFFENIINKDSLDMKIEDRRLIKELISDYYKNKNIDRFIIIHGTDTIDITAKYLNRCLKHYGFFRKAKILLLGSMIPFSQNKTEPSFNLGVGYGFLQSNKKKGVFISMNGIISKWDKIKKNKDKLIFEEIKTKKKVQNKECSIKDLEKFKGLAEKIKIQNEYNDNYKVVEKNKEIIVDNYFCPDCTNKVKTTESFQWFQCVHCRKIETSINSFVEFNKLSKEKQKFVSSNIDDLIDY